jgi:hypothetical protein
MIASTQLMSIAIAFLPFVQVKTELIYNIKNKLRHNSENLAEPFEYALGIPVEKH